MTLRESYPVPVTPKKSHPVPHTLKPQPLNTATPFLFINAVCITHSSYKPHPPKRGIASTPQSDMSFPGNPLFPTAPQGVGLYKRTCSPSSRLKILTGPFIQIGVDSSCLYFLSLFFFLFLYYLLSSLVP